MLNCRFLLLLLLQIIVCHIPQGKADKCEGCTLNNVLRSESQNISYGPSKARSCNCVWTIPTTMSQSDKTAVVLLLKNASLPMTTGSTGSITDCSGKIRFPGTDGHKCNFMEYYCLAFATKSSICDTNKVWKQILNNNHTCDSFKLWKEVESPYKIDYYAGNFDNYNKYFTIQYIVVNCQPPTTTAQPTTTAKPTTHVSTPASATSASETPLTTPESDRSTRHPQSNATSENISISTLGESSTTILEKKPTSQQAANSLTITISVVIPITVLLIGLMAALMIMRYTKRKRLPVKSNHKNKDDFKKVEKTIVENEIYGQNFTEQGPEMVVNEIYDTTGAPQNDEAAMAETEPSCVYAVVQKHKK